MPVGASNLTEAFEAGTLDPATFTHQDHVAVAYDMLNAYEFLEACQKYAETIRALAEKAGAPMKFNATITLAFLSLIAERMSAGQYRGYEDFISQNADLKSKQVLEKWYSAERLTCETARKVFLLPDAV